jgi:hypothetical protein
MDRYPEFDIVYNDVESKFLIDLDVTKKQCCDCRGLLNNQVLKNFDFLIATPPCNFYSRANYRRWTSQIALSTKDLLPLCLSAFIQSCKPFLVENVNNKSLLPVEFDKFCYRFNFGGHTFFTNVYFDISDLTAKHENKQFVCRSKRDGNYNVHVIIDRFLYVIHHSYCFKPIVLLEPLIVDL